jgi:hypothetical protein
LDYIRPVGVARLDGLWDRSHRPQVSPNATRTQVVGKLISLRQYDHLGPARIAMYLKRSHQVQISSSGGWRILKAAGAEPAARLPAPPAPRPALAAL